MDYETYITFGPEDEAHGCQCDRCNGEPDFDENDKPREGVREPWPGA